MSDTKHPFEERQSLQDYFRTIMHTVMGQAFAAAGYDLKQEPMRWLGGRFRYTKTLPDNFMAYIEFQVLVYNDNAWSGKQPSRFRVNLIRSDVAGGKPSQHPDYVQRTLSQLVVEDFGVEILPSSEHWWVFTETDSLGKALAEAGHLVIGYGIPFLAGDLNPNAPQSDD
ncbi:MAG: hypothetical protein WBC91_06230 [Phototrophicaceae bacterium]